MRHSSKYYVIVILCLSSSRAFSQTQHNNFASRMFGNSDVKNKIAAIYNFHLTKCFKDETKNLKYNSYYPEVRAFYNKDGSLRQDPIILNPIKGLELYANAAVRAIRKCAPLKDLPEKYQNYYDLWDMFATRFSMNTDEEKQMEKSEEDPRPKPADGALPRHDILGVVIGDKSVLAQKRMIGKGYSCDRGSGLSLANIFCKIDPSDDSNMVVLTDGLADNISRISFRFKTYKSEKTIEDIEKTYGVNLIEDESLFVDQKHEPRPYGGYHASLPTGEKLTYYLMPIEDFGGGTKLSSGSIALEGLPFGRRSKPAIVEPHF